MSVRADVDRGLEIVRKIAELEKELKDIEQRLQKAGLEAGQRGEHQDLKDEERGGKRWLARGSGAAVPLIFTDDKLVSSFTANGAKHQTIRVAANGHLLDFYRPVNKFESKFEDGKKFRAAAAEILAERAPAFITACLATDKAGIPKSDIKILWGDIEDIKPS
jgi:hypothetical protein